MRGIEYLHPKARAKAEALQRLCEKIGLPLLITETLRTVDEQDALYAKGRTTPGNNVRPGKPMGDTVTNARGSGYSSCHQWGIAFDFCRNVKGKEWDDSDGFFKKVADLAKSLGGITWGGDWKSIVDKPHLQLTEFSPDGTASFLKNKYVIPDAFKKTWGDSGGSTAPAPSAPTSSPGGKPTLKEGSRGDDVKIAQAYLRGHGAEIAVDGIFGPDTRAATVTFQEKNGLTPVDGIIGPKTWAKLEMVPAKSTPAAAIPKTIREGSRGDDVKKAQKLLGGDLKADGIFGIKTKTSVMVYQKTKGLSTDGIIGPKTWGLLLK